MGGLSKKAHLINTLARQGQPTLVVESGNLLFKADVVPPAELVAARIGAEAIANAIRRMGATFAGIGSRDLAGGIDFLRHLHQPPAFTWLSLNLVDPTSGQPLFSPLLHQQAGGLRLVVLGLTDHQAFADQALSGGSVLPWRQVLSQAVARVAGQADFVLLLSNYSYTENREIARACAGIDLILQSGHVGGNMHPIIFDRTLLAQTEIRGRSLGVLDINWQGHVPWREGSAGRVSLSKPQPSTFSNRFIALTPALPDDPAIETLVRQTRSQMKRLAR